MKLAIFALTIEAALLPSLWAQRRVSALIADNGISILQRADDGHHLVLQFTTHTVQPPKETQDFPYDWSSDCTGSLTPCVLLDNLQIRYDDHRIFISRSAYADCSDFGHAAVTLHDGIYSLRLQGGNAEGGYIVTIRFNHTRVLDRTLVSGEDSSEILERTTYYRTQPLN